MENVWQRFSDTFSQNVLVEILVKTLVSLIVLVVFTILARILRGLVMRVTDRATKNVNLPYLLSNLVYVTLLVIGGVAIFSIYTGAGVTNLVTVLSVVSLAISLSLQDVLKNFVAGVYLLLEQPFNVGDRIRIKEFEGKIDNIQIRTTSLSTDDGLLVYVPNSLLFSEVVINRTAFRQRLIIIRFTLPSDKIEYTVAREKIKAIVETFDKDLVSQKPAPLVAVEAISATETKARLDLWSPIAAPTTTNSDIMLAMIKAVPELSITGVTEAAK